MIKNFIVINEEFVCQNCGFKNEKHESSCRNHCAKCLYSLHVDEEIPGDRKSKCRGLMEPISLNSNAKKGYMIVHKCTKCAKLIQNKCAPDDDKEKLIQLSLSQKINE